MTGGAALSSKPRCAVGMCENCRSFSCRVPKMTITPIVTGAGTVPVLRFAVVGEEIPRIGVVGRQSCREWQPNLERIPIMRRALMGTLAGWLASATCLLAQPPRYFPADGPPSTPPDRASAGSMLTPYGRYNQASQVDTCRCEDQRNQANYRSNNTVTPAVAGPVMMNSNGQGPTYGNPNVMNGNGNNGPMINAKAVYSPAMVDGNGNYGPGTTNGTYQATPLTNGQMLQG